MSHSPLFFMCVGWVLVVGLIRTTAGILGASPSAQTGAATRMTGVMAAAPAPA